MNIKRILIILLHAFIGWALCAAVMAIGPNVFSMDTTLIIHLIGAPVFFASASRIYFKKFNYTSPLVTALIFVSFVILVDLFLVAMLILNSYDIFKSPIGTWIPFSLIFLSTYISGLIITKSNK